MCGICGRLNFAGAVEDAARIARMCATLVHRGPDDEGIHTAPYVGLGQRRLSIIDLRASATAPLPNEDKTIWVVFNGEIYNFQELRSRLERRSHSFRTKTDTEVIVHLYEEYGTDCLQQMRGMFAFALWDSKRRLLFAARDRLGKKPFCYAKTSRAFVFGSEIKAITADPDISVAPDYAAIDQYLRYQYVPSPLTAFEGISKLPPGHYLICSADGSLRVEPYWTAPAPAKTGAFRQEIEQEILAQLREAVRLRMIADVPLGAFLSGGVDSTTLVALMAQESTQPIKTFSIGFEDDAYNELPYARLLAERYGTDHHEYVVKPDAAEVLPLLVKHYNEPFADSSAIPTYYVSKMTRQSVTVALCGDGGDENFAGYDHYRAVLRWSKCDMIPYPVRRSLGQNLSALLDRFPYNNTLARLSRGLAMLGSRLGERYLLNMSFLKPQERRVCYSDHFRKLLTARSGVKDPVSSWEWDSTIDPLDGMMRHDQSFYLPDCLMVKSDIASMANSLEVRSPFLDHKFVEFAATISASFKSDGTVGKLILRSAVRGLIPDPILTKRKTGFAVPLARWLQGDLYDLLRSTLLDDGAARRDLFDRGFVRKMVEEHATGRRNWAGRLWALLFLELWFREFID